MYQSIYLYNLVIRYREMNEKNPCTMHVPVFLVYVPYFKKSYFSIFNILTYFLTHKTNLNLRAKI